MRKYVTTSLFIFWAIIVAVLVAGLIYYNNDKQAIINPNTGGVGQIGNITGVSSGVTDLILSSAELAKHNSANSCWLLISGKIYDVTPYLNNHPGGEAEILKTCGTDATTAYDTKDNRNRPHSTNANAMLADYYIGDLNQTLKLNSNKTTTTTSAKINNTTKTVPNSASVITPTLPIQTTPKITPSATLALTSTELAKHNSANSCWLLISGKIYDVTTYIRSHPGGANQILPTCGTDATQAYATRGGTGTHSSSANADLAAYYIGDLNQTVTTNPANPTTPAIANPNPTLPQSRGDDEFDD